MEARGIRKYFRLYWENWGVKMFGVSGNGIPGKVEFRVAGTGAGTTACE